MQIRPAWDSLRYPGSLGVALFDIEQPRIVAADPELCARLDWDAGALDGVPVCDIELDHPFATSSDAWRSHVLNVRNFEPIHWSTWLTPRGRAAGRGVLRLCTRNVEGKEYLVAALLELTPASAAPTGDPRWLSLDAVPNGACRMLSDGSLSASNAAARAFLEFSFDGPRGAYSTALPETCMSVDRQPLGRAELPWHRAIFESARQEPMTLGLPRADGSVIWALVSCAPELDPLTRTATSALVTLVDVTASKEASDALKEADRTLRRTINSVNNLQDQLARSEHMASLGLMAAGVAHEINNPLSYILSNLAFAVERAIDQESRLALREALEGAGRVRDIVRDLKTLSRMESEEELKPVDARNAVDAALKLSFEEVRHRARVQRHFREVPRVLGDETRLVQVMLNLVTNAAQSITPGDPDGNQITVEVKPAETDGQVEIVVADTGAGISADHLPKVFEPFFTTKPAGEGTGLGLSICHRLVHAMGGSIHVTSEPGKGSRFSVRLQVAGTDVTEIEPPPSELASSTVRRRRLLIIDDEVLVARAVRRSFERDFRVEIALDGKSALEKLRANDYDVVLCDVMMPDTTGLEIFRLTRDWNEALANRFVFATGGFFSQELSESVKRLSNMIVEKPFQPAELRRVIDAAIRALPEITEVSRWPLSR